MLLITVPIMPEQLVVMEAVPSDQRLWSLYKGVGAGIQQDLRPIQILTIYGLIFIIRSLSSHPS